MSFTEIREIPTPEEIINLVPLSGKLKEMKLERDNEIQKIVKGESDKFLIIVGPCSADDEAAVCEYVYKLAEINDKVKDKLFIIPRVYTNKPRTTGEGYKGMMHQPDPEQKPNAFEGILKIRRMHVKAMEGSGLTAADEMLYPDNLMYVEDMLSYIAIGARSSENQQHRIISSGISLPVGMKNPMSGDLSIMYNAIYAAQIKHTFIYHGHEVETSGNELCHAVMRGSVNKHGNHIPNYHYEDLLFSCEMYASRGLKNPMVIVDTNHSNSQKQYLEQIRISKEIINSRKYNTVIKKNVRGLMIESYLEEGSQKISDKVYGKSITDACINIKQTENLLLYLADNV
ncbi:MAG: 3-deoxy-7-phosphoheptulonate synthase [Clostridiales bacterium]|nr:3-deoxy-7-phosphoheptulonate synthase [Clostridiales bacterium]